MTLDRTFVDENRAATARLRDLMARLSDNELSRRVGEHWTVGAALAHLAFWDGRVLAVLNQTQREGKFSTPTIDIIVNDIALPLWLAIPPREAGRIAIETAEKLDQRLEAYSPELLEQVGGFNMRYLFRSRHRNEHLDEVENALKG